MTDLLKKDKDYVDWLKQLKTKVRQVQLSAAGKLNFYVSAVDGILKTAQDNPTVGILICKSKNKRSKPNWEKPMLDIWKGEASPSLQPYGLALPPLRGSRPGTPYPPRFRSSLAT